MFSFSLVAFICMISLTEESILCPSKCKCSNLAVSCTSQGLLHGDLKSLGVGLNTTSLDLSKNKIEKFPVELVQKLLRLEILILNSNGIRSLPSDVTSSSLQSLHLCSNSIREIASDDLAGLTNLNFIVLDQNQIKLLPGFIFSKSKKLNHVSLKNNEIEHISATAFHSSESIADVHLDGNKLKQLPSRMFGNRQIFTLSVTNNQLTELPSDLRVIQLLLSNNNLGNSKTALSDVSVALLDMASNHIQSLSKRWFNESSTNIEMLSLNNNSVRCDCNLNFIQRTVGTFLGKCSGPSKLVESDIDVVKNDILPCDACSVNPCRNLATCKMTPSNFICVCPKGFQGKKCDVIKTCETSQPCKNNGHCVDIATNRGFVCKCTSGFNGETCQKLKTAASLSTKWAVSVFVILSVAVLLGSIFLIRKRMRMPPPEIEQILLQDNI